MDVVINITKNLKDQFKTFFEMRAVKNSFRLNPSIGNGEMQYLEFPGQLEFYHFKQTQFTTPINMKSLNPVDTDWFLIHINLASVKQEKVVDGKQIDFQKYLPIGMLLYGPGLEIDTRIPPHIDSELASIRFSRSFLNTYFGSADDFIDMDRTLVYEDLDPILETKLALALNSVDDKIKCHALVLDFMKQFFDKLRSHDKGVNFEKLHPEDFRNLFLVSAHLRNPTSEQIPSLKELAALANMGTTKFKILFKQVFGKPPIEYRNKIRMEFAKNEMVANGKSPSEVSYTLGYSHPSNFTAAYKKYFGELPSML